MFVEGPPGLGKTRLLEMIAESAQWRGLSVVWGQARELADHAAEARILRAYNFYRILIAAVSPADALANLQRAVALAESVRDYPVLVSALCTLAFTYRLSQGEPAYIHTARALALTETHPNSLPRVPMQGKCWPR